MNSSEFNKEVGMIERICIICNKPIKPNAKVIRQDHCRCFDDIKE